MQLLADKIIFLTGGSKGIGFECAMKYKLEGARVVVMANDAPSLELTKETLGDDHTVVYGDVSIAEDVERAIQLALTKYGKLDVIHNNAGIANPSKPLHETTEAEWQHLYDVNLKGNLFTCRYGLAALKASHGSIINTSSLVGEIGQSNHAAYAATKGAINALTKCMALDYAPYKIRVNAVAPAGVRTPMLTEWEQEQEENGSSQMHNYLNEIHPLGYCPDGDVVADACVFLASHMARFITGSIMYVSGGAELGYRRLP